MEEEACVCVGGMWDFDPLMGGGERSIESPLVANSGSDWNRVPRLGSNKERKSK